MPDEYKELDVVAHLYSLCKGDDERFRRVNEELAEFQRREMFNLLRYMIYLVDFYA